MTRDSSFGGQKQTKQNEMKRFLTMIVAVCAFFVASAANPMVTLSHNGELSFFTNLGAFKAAYDAAKDGDIIYLSEGDFILDGGSCTIAKRLNIVGNGYSSHLLGDIYIDMSNNANAKMDAPLFDGVRLDDLSFNNGGTSMKNLGESEIRRSWIRKITRGDHAGTDVLYDNCYIESIDFVANGGNVLLKNSKIKNLNSNYNVSVINCNIDNAKYYPRSMFSSILNNETKCTSSGKCSIHNSLLRFDHQDGNLTTYDCYLKTDSSLLDDKLETTVDLVANGYFGADGEVVGIHGGESPFSENPSVPTVDTANSSVEYDSASNKLKVNITVKAD